MDLKATVIIITYNQEDTISRALESVLHQKCQYPYEILIADDCSADGTRRICEEYARRYPDKIRLMPEMPNRGLVGNYFDAVDAARGEYISDCAGDDEWLYSYRLSNSIEALDADKSLSAVFTDVELVDIESGKAWLASEDDDRNMYMKPRVKGADVLLGVLGAHKGLPYTLSAALYRKSSLDKVYKTHPEMVRCPESGIEDVPVIAALASVGDAAYLPITGYRYYITQGSVSNNVKDFVKTYWFYARVLSVVRKLGEFYGIPKEKLKNFFNDKISYIAAQARHGRRPDLAEDLEERRKEWGFRLPPVARVQLAILRADELLFRNRINNI